MTTSKNAPWQNWGRTVRARPESVVVPSSVDDVCEVVRAAAASSRRVKAVGAGHSFTAIAGGYTESRAEKLATDWSADADIIGFEIRPQQA